VRRATKCPCGHPLCSKWHVEPEAALQGVGFSEKQAYAVVALLNDMDGDVAAPARPGREQMRARSIEYAGRLRSWAKAREAVNRRRELEGKTPDLDSQLLRDVAAWLEEVA